MRLALIVPGGRVKLLDPQYKHLKNTDARVETHLKKVATAGVRAVKDLSLEPRLGSPACELRSRSFCCYLADALKLKPMVLFFIVVFLLRLFIVRGNEWGRNS